MTPKLLNGSVQFLSLMLHFNISANYSVKYIGGHLVNIWFSV